MFTNLIKYGDGWAIPIDPSMLEALKLNPQEPIELTTDGRTMMLSQVTPDQRRAKVQAARAKINERYSETFKKLAE